MSDAQRHFSSKTSDIGQMEPNYSSTPSNISASARMNVTLNPGLASENQHSLGEGESIPNKVILSMNGAF